MLYVCSCGFSVATATAFYKHLAASKESGGGHQLTRTRFSDKAGKDDTKPNNLSEPAGQQAPGIASWVEEYLVVDQRDTASQGPSQAAQEPLPVSSGPPAAGPARSLQFDSEVDDVPLRDLRSMSRGWSSLGRQRTSTAPRPAIPTGRAVASAAPAVDLKGPILDSDEVEIVENIRTSSSSGAGHGSGSLGGAVGGTATQAALRMSGSVVNAMVVGLSPWRWFGNGTGGSPSRAAAEHGAAEPSTGPGPQPSPKGVAAGADGNGLDPIAEVGPSTPRSQHSWPTASLTPVHTVRDVLIWQDPWRTTRIFGAGLYLAVCVQQLARGHELLQPSTAILGLSFVFLLRNVLREAASQYRRNQQQQYQPEVLRDAASSKPDASPRDDEVERRKAAMMLQQRLEALLEGVALGTARYGAALLVLASGLLNGRRAITSALVAVLLWLGMVLGELRVISQPMFWLLCYIAAFTIPPVYYRCRHAMDAGVEAALRFIVRVLVSGSRTSLLTASVVAMVLVAVLPLNFILRASLAAGGAFGVLLWQSELAKRGHRDSGAIGATGWAAGNGQVEGRDGGVSGLVGRLLAGSPIRRRTE